MNSTSISIRPSDMAPVLNWLDEVRGRVEKWSRGVRAVTSDEWTRLQGAVTGAISVGRVEKVLREFLGRVGIRGRQEDLTGSILELRERIVCYRRGQTIEAYAEHLCEPPRIEV